LTAAEFLRKLAKCQWQLCCRGRRGFPPAPAPRFWNPGAPCYKVLWPTVGRINRERKITIGQARQRGSLEQRVADAQARRDAKRPKSITCNDCKGEITEIQEMDTTGMAGIDAAFAGICPACKCSTYAVRGKRKSVEAFMLAMAKASGEVPLLGAQ